MSREMSDLLVGAEVAILQAVELYRNMHAVVNVNQKTIARGRTDHYSLTRTTV